MNKVIEFVGKMIGNMGIFILMFALWIVAEVVLIAMDHTLVFLVGTGIVTYGVIYLFKTFKLRM